MEKVIQLTKREVEIVRLITKGFNNKEIAEILYISHHTVKANLENIFFKTGMTNRVMLAVWAVKNLGSLEEN